MAVAAALTLVAACTINAPAESTPTTPDQIMPTATTSVQTAPTDSAGDQNIGARAPGGGGSETSPFSAADGYVADDEPLSPFDIGHPAVGNLDPDLLAAVQLAANDARLDGVEMFITSGWRSERYQQGLLDEAIITYGSEDEARKWVNTPELSTHVTGDAVDIGPLNASDWLIQRGNEYGLCQTYANETWHFELAVEPSGVCPPPLSDASAGSVPNDAAREK